jgi:hypothetical protein
VPVTIPVVVSSVSVALTPFVVAIVAVVAAVVVPIGAAIATIMVRIDRIGNTSGHEHGRTKRGQREILHGVSWLCGQGTGTIEACLSGALAGPCAAPPTTAWRPHATVPARDSLAIGNALLHLPPHDRELAPTFLR